MVIRTPLITLAVLIIFAGTVAYLGNIGNFRTGGNGSAVACTMEAKLCPDGSAVGRSGPNCEFAKCPDVTTYTSTGPVSLDARIGQEASGFNLSITPLEVLEDSRCPIDVQCIQAGTVRIRARLISGLGEANQEFKLDEPITTEVERVTLTAVSPLPKAGIKIKDSDYIFSFEVAKRADNTPPSDSGIRGTVMLGPTCPVMRDPPDPKCADRGYETQISIYRASDTTRAIATAKSDFQGVFDSKLPPGEYVVYAEGGQMLPRCSPVTVSVTADAYASVSIQCDTGIR